LANKTMVGVDPLTAPRPVRPLASAATAPIADDGKGRPEQRMAVGQERLALNVGKTFNFK
jgi:hypothetical protein